MIDSILNKYINNERTQLFDNYTPDAIKELLSLCFNPQVITYNSYSGHKWQRYGLLFNSSHAIVS
jgi:hypothetical protein